MPIRSPWQILALLLATLLPALQPARADATQAELFWDVSAGLVCPSPGELAQALKNHLPTSARLHRGSGSVSQNALFVGTGPNGTLQVWIRSAPSETFRDREVRVDRVPCAQRAEAVALIVDAWFKALPSPGGNDAARPPPAVDASVLAAASRVPPRSSEPAPAPAPDKRGSSKNEESTNSRQTAFELRGGVLGVLGIDSATSGIGGAVALDFWINRRFGFGIQLDIVSHLFAADPVVAGAEIIVNRQALALYGSWRPSPTRLPGLSVLAGAQLQRLDAWTTGYSVDGQQTALPAAFWAALAYRWELARRIELFGQLAVSAGPAEQFFFVTGPPGSTRTLVTVPAASATLLVGLVIDLL